MLQTDHTPALPVRPPAPPAPVLAPPVWRVLPAWQGLLPLQPATLAAAAAAFPAAVGGWVRRDADSGLVALVDGCPRPEQAPQTAELEADPGLALLQSYAQRGLSALRHAEGAWSLVLWQEEVGQWLLAADRLGRCPLAWRVQAGQLAVCSGSRALAAVPPRAAGTAGAGTRAGASGWTLVAPGTHLHISTEGVSTPAFHGTWRLERRDRRGWDMIQGEFRERLNSVLHALEDFPGHLLLADDPTGAALLLQLLQSQGRPPAAVLWLPGWSDLAGRPGRAAWQPLCAHFGVPLMEAHGHAPPAITGSTAPDDAAQPQALVSACAFEVLLPARAEGWLQRCRDWRPWQADAPARPALHGARVVRALHDHWQPDLQRALSAAGVAGHVVWPLLDETVAHFAANLPEALRSGTPWRHGFRAAALRAQLPAAVRRLLPG